MRTDEPRDPRRNWQEDYNKWWNRVNGTPAREHPAPEDSGGNGQ